MRKNLLLADERKRIWVDIYIYGTIYAIVAFEPGSHLAGIGKNHRRGECGPLVGKLNHFSQNMVFQGWHDC